MRLGKKRRGSGGWSWVVIMVALAVFAAVMTALMFVQGQFNTMLSSQPTLTGTYDPNSSTAMGLIFYPGIPIVVAFSAIIEVINLNQKKRSGEEVI